MAYAAGEELTAQLLNALLARSCQTGFVGTPQTTTSTSYTDLATVGPSVTLISAGTTALVMWSAGMFSGDATYRGGYCDFTITGATARAANDASAAIVSATNGAAGFRSTGFEWVTITPGSNTYTLKYKSLSGSFNFQNRRLFVFAP